MPPTSIRPRILQGQHPTQLAVLPQIPKDQQLALRTSWQCPLATLISSFHPDLPNKAGHPHTPHPLFHGFFDTMPDSRHGPPRPRRPARTPFSRPTYAAVKRAHPPHHRTASPLWMSPEYGAISPATAAPRAFPLPDRQWPHVRPARPASLGRLPGTLLSLTVAPLGQPSPRPPLDCRGISKSRM